MSKIKFHQGRIVFEDEADAIEYWADKEWKKFAVDVVAGPARRPVFKNTIYVRARSGETAINCARREIITKPPRGARFIARLAGPRELGCVPTPAFGAQA